MSSARRYGPASANRSSECQNREEADPPFADLGRRPSGGLCFGARRYRVVPVKRSSNGPPVNRLYPLVGREEPDFRRIWAGQVHLRRIISGRIGVAPIAGAGLGRGHREPPIVRPTCWPAIHQPWRSPRKPPSIAPQQPGRLQGSGQYGRLWTWISMSSPSPSIGYGPACAPFCPFVAKPRSQVHRVTARARHRAGIGQRTHLRTARGLIWFLRRMPASIGRPASPNPVNPVPQNFFTADYFCPVSSPGIQP